MTLVITTCTNRKRKPVPDSLHVSALPQARIAEVVCDWVARLSAAPEVFPACDIYGGRLFQEALFATDLLDARLLIVSAGLGLVWADTFVPPYACTVVVNAPDSIASRILGDYAVPDWWQALSAASPLSQSLAAAVASDDGLICAALSSAYLEMIAGDLSNLPAEVLARLRLFTRVPPTRVVPTLRPFLMPYDDRLDGPDSTVRGTRGDFSGRALRHFAEYVVCEDDSRSADAHGAAVADMLEGWRLAPRFDRKRVDDAGLLALIREHWNAERGSTARLLRCLRDDLGVACEQGRFADLARHVRGEKA